MKKVDIYTDGSCSGNPGPGGWAAILMAGKARKEISGGEPETTNNRMELTAPIEALSALKEPCKVDMYSDSAYVANMFIQGWVQSWEKKGWTKKGGPIKNLDLIKKLYELCGQHEVTWHRVQGHADNEYNNRCDELAVAETEKQKQALAQLEEVRDNFYEGSLGEEIVAAQTAFEGRIFKVERLDVVLPDGHKSVREVVRHNGGACVVAVDEDEMIYMVQQFRIAAGCEMLEIPAGKLEAGEDPLECAVRELTEETGMRAEKIECLASFYPTPGYCSEKLHIYMATGLKPGNPHRDPGEFLSVRKYKLSQLIEMIWQGKIIDGKTIAGLLMAASKLGVSADPDQNGNA